MFETPDEERAQIVQVEASAATERGGVLFVEHGTHKTIYPGYPWGSGFIRVSDQAIIDALREAFEKAGVEVEDRVG